MSQPPDEPTPPAHKRRPRYQGTHPKRFEERYKELEAEKYPEIVPHVMAKGRTPAGQHVPIMVEEILELLAPVAGARAVDCTLGYGGHAQCLLERLVPGGHLLGLDADPIELPRTEARLRALGYEADVLTMKRTNFAGLVAAIAAQGWLDGADHWMTADQALAFGLVDEVITSAALAAAPIDVEATPLPTPVPVPLVLLETDAWRAFVGNRGLRAGSMADQLQRIGLAEVVKGSAGEEVQPRRAAVLLFGLGRGVLLTLTLSALAGLALAWWREGK